MKIPEMVNQKKLDIQNERKVLKQYSAKESYKNSNLRSGFRKKNYAITSHILSHIFPVFLIKTKTKAYCCYRRPFFQQDKTELFINRPNKVYNK